MKRQDGRGDEGREKHVPPTSPWEWLAAAVGLVLVAGAIGYLVHFGLTHRDDVPAVRVERTDVVAAGDAHVVRFRLVNGSGAAAAGLRVEGELREGETVIERSEAVLDYLPPFSERKGGLLFRHDPGRYELLIRPTGYSDP